MRELRHRQLLGVILLWAFFWPGRAWSASEEFQKHYDIRSMVQQNPDFSTYPGFDGLIWLKRFDYAQAPRGGVERVATWVLLGRKGLDPRWLTWEVPVPPDGKVEFLEASVYSLQSAEKIAGGVSFERTQGSVKMTGVSFDNLPNDYILVVVCRETYPHRLTVDDLVWIGEALPVWETLVNVTVPAANTLFSVSDPELIPDVRSASARNKNYVLYTWRAINTPGEPRFSLRASERPFMAFGMREGADAAVRVLKSQQERIVPSLREDILEAPKKKGASKGEVLLTWLYRQPTLFLPEGSSRELPPEAPWTREEKVFLAYAWARQLGLDVKLLWNLPFRPGNGIPVGDFSATGPVLEITPPESRKGAEPFWVDMRVLPRWGESSPFLWGKKLYNVNNTGKLEERTVPSLAASDNKLSLVFNLKLSREAILSGTIKLQLRNAWAQFLIPNEPSSEDLQILVHEFFPGLPRGEDMRFQKNRDGGEIVFSLPELQMIKGTQGRNILVAWPAFTPQWLASLNGGVPYSLRFPFVLDAKVTLAMPEGTQNVILHEPLERGSGKIRYTHSYKMSRKKVVTAEARLAVTTLKIDEAAVADLKNALQGWYLFMTHNLPVQLLLQK